MPDEVTGWIEHVRLIIEAVADSRVEARTIAGMSDEQLTEYRDKLRDEAAAEIERGKRMHENEP